MSGRPQENVKWVDGLRGVASLLVVFTHLARGFDEELFKPVSQDPAIAGPVAPRILQYPILRILVQGRIGVSIFSLVTGYVCALKPIKQFRGGAHDAAFPGIAKSAFRRLPRLILPTTIATVISWLICQFGAFEVAKHTAEASVVETKSEGWWLSYSSPTMTPNLGAAIQDLILNMITTWTRLWNIYDINQWTLQPLLMGAFWVYVMLMATAYVRPRHRMMISLGLVVFFYLANDSAFGMQLFFGTFLSDLSQEQSHSAWLAARKWPGRVLSPVLVGIGLVLASYPEKNPEWMPWSASMERIGHYIFPATAEFPRYYSGLGLVFLTFGIHFSSSVKDILSSKYLLWFGKNSFAVYLIHGTLLRTILVWMIFGVKVPADVQKEDGTMGPAPPLQQGSRAAWYFWVPIWLVILYTSANFWTKHVDPFCARLTATIERYVFEEKYTSQPNGLRTNPREKVNASPLPR